MSSATKPAAPIRPKHFASAKAFGAWLDKHHAGADELWVALEEGTGKASIDWPQAVREALRVGWIDGIRKSLDDEAYMIRFLPRRPGSVWSAINIRIAEALIATGAMTAARFGVRNAYDAAQNVRGGTAYLQWLLAYYQGDVSLAVAAYNAGEGAVDRYRGVPPSAETRAYVRKVLDMFGWYFHPFEADVTEPSPRLGAKRAMVLSR